MKKPKRMLSTESLSSTGTASTDEDADVVSLSDAELLEGQVELDEQQVDAMITRAASTKESGPAVKVEVEEIMDSPVKGPRPKTTFTELAEPKIDPSRLASLRANLARAKQELGRRTPCCKYECFVCRLWNSGFLGHRKYNRFLCWSKFVLLIDLFRSL